MIGKPTSEEKKHQRHCQVLNALLGLGEASKLRLYKELEMEMSRATLSKRVKELVAKDMIKIEKGPRGPVGTHNCDITFKGLMYLILECNLEEEDFERALMKLFSHEKLQYMRHFVDRFTLVQAGTESISELRFKVNLQYFDEDWVSNLLTLLVEKAFLKRFGEVPRHTPEEVKKKIKRTGKKNQILKWCNSQLKLAQRMRRECERRIKFYRMVSDFVKDIR